MSGERRAVEAARRLDVEQAGRPGTAAGDPYAAAWLGHLDRTRALPRVELGTIVDVVPGAHAYRVAAGPRSYVYCTALGPDAAFGASGARPSHTFPLLAPVYFVREPESLEFGYIIGAQPHWSLHTGNQPADAIWPFTRTGFGVEPAHQFPVAAQAEVAQSAGLPSVEGADFSAGRPFDGTAIGEWGRVTETGLRFHLDPFCLQVGTGEYGLAYFYEDDVVRLAALNYQFQSTLEETEHLADTLELYGYTARSVYPWEAQALWRYNQVTPNWAAPAVSNNGLAGGQGELLTDPYASGAGSGFAVREPEAPGQLAAARLFSWAGYLGQGGHAVVGLPLQPEFLPAGARTAQVGYQAPAPGPAGAPSGRLTVNGAAGPAAQPLAVAPNQYNGPDRPGVLEEHRTLPGGYAVRSATRIVFAKRPSIPVPRPVATPPDPAGDAPASGYAGSGLSGNAVVHKVRSDVAGTTDPAQRACVLPDAVAYLFNWEHLHPFAYHALDWAVAQEGAAVVNQLAPAYATLSSLDRLAAPAPTYLDVDHRYGLTPVYENESFFGLLEDGSVVLRDGWGSEIRMGGGQIELRAAGDVRLHAGRDVMAWGGYDVVLRAHNSVDLTAANGDLRTKAQYNSQHLAGNSGTGGFHFESQAVCPVFAYSGLLGQDVASSGFVVRCPASTVDVQAADVRVALDPGAPADGRIYLDAGTSRSVYVRAKQHVARVSANGAVVQLFDSAVGALAGAHEYTLDHVLLGTNLYVAGQTVLNGCLTVNGWIVGAAHVATAQSAAYSGLVAQYTGSPAASVAAMLSQEAYLVGTYGPTFDAQTVPAPNAAAAEYSCRTQAQYLSGQFQFWRSHWEAVAAGAGQALTAWTEPAVTGLVSGSTTRPFPGERWEASGGYQYQTYAFVDPTAGWTAIDRTANQGTYETGTPPGASSGTLAALYPITVPPYG